MAPLLNLGRVCVLYSKSILHLIQQYLFFELATNVSSLLQLIHLNVFGVFLILLIKNLLEHILEQVVLLYFLFCLVKNILSQTGHVFVIILIFSGLNTSFKVIFV